MAAGEQIMASWSQENVLNFLKSLPRPRRLKDAMRLTYPQVPHDIKVRGVLRPMPPLMNLCPSGSYTTTLWEVDVASWFQEFPDVLFDSDSSTCEPQYLQVGGINILGDMAQPFRDKSEMFRFFCSGGMPRPEGCFFCKETRLPLMFCLVDFHWLPGNLSVVLDRLMNYMQVTGVRFGLVTCMTSTWMCRRDEESSGGGGSGEVLSVSEPLDNPLMGIGFLIEQARNDQRRLPIVTRPAARFNYRYGLEVIKSLCDESILDADKILDNAVIGDTFKIEDLTDAKLIPLACQNRYSSVVAMRGKYKNQEVVVKIRDLTCPYYAGFHYGLLGMVVEVDIYMRLKELQGHGVPRLLSWGFMKGCMFTFVMLSDEGRSRIEDIGFNDLGNPKRNLVLPRAVEILHEIHKRGVVLPKLNITSIVTEQDVNGDFSVSLVGLRKAKVVQVMSQKWFELMVQGTTALKNLIEFITNDIPSSRFASSSAI